MTVSLREVNQKILGYVSLTFLGYLTIGLSLATLPIFIHQTLGFNTIIAGLVISVQYIATFLLRGYAGKIVDTKGPKISVLRSMLFFALSGLLLLLVFLFRSQPLLSLGLLLITRLFTGIGEGLVGASPINWALMELGDEHAAKAISFNGIASYGALAIGAPLGVLLVDHINYEALALLTSAIGLLGYFYCRAKTPYQVAGKKAEKVSFRRVLLLVAPFGICLALGGLGFGSISTFMTLYYEHFNWENGAACLTLFGVFFILTRLIFNKVIDQYGGLKVALVSLFVETVGLTVIAVAIDPLWTLLGAALTGFGFSLVFPALGVEAIKRVDQSQQGSALAAYGLFIDISLGITGPLIGFVANNRGMTAIYPFSTMMVCIGFAVVGNLLYQKQRELTP
ncbi:MULTISPECIES: MFS transporter [Sphingobacterium]|jgi:MFS family permease|uniref:MFS transporter n=1 Tax=Sphingobacterium TaxID=28453 RepID=UPI000EDB1E91|nr:MULTISPECIES: MFS transporter [Sphingobacterium]MDF2850452.1 transporter [Sphingobacterium multivorum]HAK29338.1 MFS transporter [Sphingobacterium sp.]